MISKIKPISILGPTGIGKTELLSKINASYAGQFEVVSVDSVAIYQGMDIGSAKPNTDEQELFCYHLLDICKPTQRYSVADFCHDAKQAVEKIQGRGKTPILVGGSMHYHLALLKGLANIPSIDQASRLKAGEMVRNSLTDAYDLLISVDRDLANRLSKNDAQRISRGLEVYFSTGRNLSYWHTQTQPSLFDADVFVWMPTDRACLHKRVENRFNTMLACGLIDEVKALLLEYPELDMSFPSMRSIGYRQVYEYLNHQTSKQILREKAVVATRRYVKRQLTWLRNWPTKHTLVQSSESLVSSLNARLSCM